MNKKEKDQILKETFNHIEARQETSSSPPKPSEEQIAALPKPKLKPLPFADEKKEETLFSHLPSSPTPLVALEEKISFALPPEEKFDLFENLPRNLIMPTPAQPITPLLLPPTLLPAKPQKSFDPAPPPFQDETLPLMPTYAKPPFAKHLSEAPSFMKPFSFNSIQLPQLPTLEELETASYSEEFDTEILFFEKEEGTYLFALTLIPRPDLEIPKIRQHYTFLVDRSNSIQRERLTAEKSAIKRALSELDPEDTFNIIAFDSKVEKLSPSSLSPSKESFAKAKKFLDNLQLGSFFSPADLYKPLLLTVPTRVEDNELYTAILLTDGENLTKKSSQTTLLRDWTAYNDGRVALFGIGMNGDYQLAALDAMTAFNRGKLLYSPTKRGIKRKLLKLMKTVHTPIAKDLTCKAISRSPSSKIEIFSKPSQSSHLYLNEPYVILGRTHSLDDFIIFVQGRLKDRWLNIKKTISFLNARKAGSSLKAEWALQQAYQHYEQYLLDANPQHIAEARELLEPHNLQSAF